MPRDLPGFYFDAEKNRYFPIKGPIPGSNLATNKRVPPASKKTIDESDKHGRKRGKKMLLLQSRELYGKILTFNKRRCNFQREYQNLQASQPMVWKYQNTNCVADTALEQFHVNVQTVQGQKRMNVLLTGSINGYFSLFAVGNDRLQFDSEVRMTPHSVWPVTADYKTKLVKEPSSIQCLVEGPIYLPSDVSCIKRIKKHSADSLEDSGSVCNALVATLGSGTSCGSAYVVNLNEPLDSCLSNPVESRISEMTSLQCTIWTAECNTSGTQAVLGTSQGAALLDLESRGLTWICRSKSDIFSQQFNQSGNVVLCGFRNGAIVGVDVRQREGSLAFFTGLPRQKIPYSSKRIREPLGKHGQSFTKRYFELKGNVNPSDVICASSCVCSLVWLQSDDQYLLASSMDGYVMLYDRRLIKRGPVQSYEGHVNTHSRLELAVNPSESLVMSGGEDGSMRIWSIKSGELLFGTKISNSVVSTVCWPHTETLQDSLNKKLKYEEYLFEHCQSWGVWLGSCEGLYYVHGM